MHDPASWPRRHRLEWLRRESSAKRTGSKLSMGHIGDVEDQLSTRESMTRSRPMPVKVRPSPASPGVRSPRERPGQSGKIGRNSGSPPVMRAWVTPRVAAILPSGGISSDAKGRCAQPVRHLSQAHTQRRLHRSVTEIRRSVGRSTWKGVSRRRGSYIKSVR